ncbi:MAG: sensor domain-containing diguanylate cyclase [Eubacteriales bacterium]|nr:sensor domain-containing diguanylate cyclase [Eubacteriales bacterium]
MENSMKKITKKEYGSGKALAAGVGAVSFLAGSAVYGSFGVRGSLWTLGAAALLGAVYAAYHRRKHPCQVPSDEKAQKECPEAAQGAVQAVFDGQEASREAVQMAPDGQEASRKAAPEACELQDEALEAAAPYGDCFSQDFRTALDSTEIPIYIIDPVSFEMLYCNETLRRYMGRAPLGQICYQVFQGRGEPCVGCPVVKLLREGVNESVEYRRPGGIWVLVKVSPLDWRGRQLYKVTCTDITDQKRLEEELRLYNKEYSAVVYQSTSGILRYDIGTGEASVNVDKSLCRIAEYTVSDYVNAACKSGLLDEEGIQVVRTMFQDIHSSLPSRGYDVHLTLPGGEMRWYHLDYTLLEDREGKPYRAVVSFYNNTEKREKELAYQRWNARLNALMNDYTAYMEVNLSQDLIEAEGRYGSWAEESGGRPYSKSLESMARKGIFEEDQSSFRKFFHRERLLGQFLAGKREGVLEYRTLMEGSLQWYKAEIQMVSDPSSGDVMASMMISNVDEDMREREHLRNEAERDAMTRLYNHAVAETLIRQVMELSTGERCCFLIIDLDDLRDINNTLGHPEGDRALKAIADSMKAQFRKSDIMGRIGGDEFVLLLRNAPEIDRLRSSLSAFMKRLNEIRIGPLNDWPVHASVGGTMGTAGVDDFETMYHQADLALYYTKATGKNAFHMYVPEMEKRNFSYQPRPASGLASLESFDPGEMKRLLTAVSTYCPMVISANLTKNTYHIMEHLDHASHRARDEGNYDQLVREECKLVHPEDRQGFLECFTRESLLRAYDSGKGIVHYMNRQAGKNGIYRRMKTAVIFMEDEKTGDVCDISFTHVILAEEDEEK